VHPKVVSERLGHASIGITLDTYSHVMPGMREEAAEKIDAGLRRALAGQLRSRASHPDSDGSGGAHVSLRSGQELVLSPRDRPRRTA